MMGDETSVVKYSFEYLTETGTRSELPDPAASVDGVRDLTKAYQSDITLIDRQSAGHQSPQEASYERNQWQH
jgi:hypothetical protein